MIDNFYLLSLSLSLSSSLQSVDSKAGAWRDIRTSSSELFTSAAAQSAYSKGGLVGVSLAAIADFRDLTGKRIQRD